MSSALACAEHRQFGRREINIRGRATVPGAASQPFVIRNISDGGALLKFDGAFVPKRSFRIEIDDTDFVLLCEVRHSSSQGVGVRFVRTADGAALNRHFLLKPVDMQKLGPPALEPRAVRSMLGIRVRELRAAFRLLMVIAEPFVPGRACGHKRFRPQGREVSTSPHDRP